MHGPGNTAQLYVFRWGSANQPEDHPSVDQATEDIIV